MINIRSFLISEFKKGFQERYDFDICDIADKFFNVIYVGNHGVDYSMRSLIGFQKYLKAINIDVTCEKLFDDLTHTLNINHYKSTLNGNYIDINFKPTYMCDLMQSAFNDNITSLTNNKQKILVDFSSPNIAKDMHVGHLRSTIIGDSTCKLYEFQGHEVHRINHIGDFGLQFGMIIEHLLEKYHDYSNCNLSIADLQKFYAESKKRFDTDEIFKSNAYQKVIQLQSGDTNIASAWNFIKDISRQAYNEIYDRLNINLIECGESFYQDKIPSLIDELETNGMLITENGRKIINVPNYELPLTVIKSDGGFTYDTTDLAAIRYRLVNLNMDKIIYVVDNGQGLHFELIFKVAELMGWKKNNQELRHVGFGLVTGPDGKKFKSRSGDTVKLIDLLDESLIEARKVFEKQRTDFGDDEKQLIIKNVAYGSIKYADLASIRTNDYKFSFDKMLSLKGNTGAYQLYEYVRICAILRNAGDYVNKIDTETFKTFNISQNEEFNVCKLILRFPEIIERISDELMFHTLCSYLYELTNVFSVFHKKCRCLQFNENKEIVSADYNRLLICIATKKILENCFCILGINKLERM